MYRKSLLSCTATVAIILFNIQFSAHAGNLEVSQGQQEEVKDQTYEIIHAKDGGKITGDHLTVVGNKDTNQSVDPNQNIYESAFSVTAEGNNSTIKLNNTTIQGTDSIISLGIMVKEGATLQMTGGTITVSAGGAVFANSKNAQNKLEDVTISSGKDDAPLINAIIATNSTVALKDVTVKQASSAIIANHDSNITVSGGSFEAEQATIFARNSGTVTLTNSANITSSENSGLVAQNGGAISMTGGAVTGKDGALIAEEGGHINVTDVILKTTDSDKSSAVFSDGKGSIVKLDKTTISDSTIGLGANDGGVIEMTGGTITTSIVDAGSSNSKGNAPRSLGAIADKNSTITLKDVTITQSTSALVANDHSTITASGGSFHAQNTTISAQNGSTITLTDNANITSSDNIGLYANSSNSTINMTGGAVTGKDGALVVENGGHITVTNVSLKTTGGDTSFSVVSDGMGSVVELLGETMINDSDIGLATKDGGTIKMTGGTIKTSLVGAGFLNSNSSENNLEGVKISNSKDDALLNFGIRADKSAVALKNVTVTQATNAIVTDNNSTITVSGGLFAAKETGVYAANESTITINNNAKVISSDGRGLHANGLKSKITMSGGEVTGEKIALFAENSGQIDATNIALTTNGKGTGAFAIDSGSRVELHGHTTINNTMNGLGAVDGGKITSEDLTIIGGKIIDQGPNRERTGVWTSDAGSEIHLTGKTIIENVDEGFYADGGSKIVSGDLTITGSAFKETIGMGAYEPNSSIELKGKTILRNFDIGLAAANNGTIKMINGAIDTIANKIAAKKVALLAEVNGHIDLANASVTAKEVAGLQLTSLSEADPDDLQKSQGNEINLTNVDVHVENGAGILVGAVVEKGIENSPAPSIGTVNLKNSKIHADMLLENGVLQKKIWGKENNLWDGKEIEEISNGTFTLNTDHSTLEGRAKIAQDRNVHFDLKNKTTWTLKISKNEKDDEGNLLDIAQRSRSDISTLSLDNSFIVFEKPTEEHYQTLHIGSGKPDTQAVYNASGDAKIYFNTTWSDGNASADQKTDRLLIHGNVSGSTTVYIASDLGDKNSVVNASDPSNTGGLSLIQVSGEAKEDSFKLAKGYTTIGGEPYKYTLTGYGPTSSHGNADIAQNLFDEKNENFWDFRLHKAFLDTGSGSGLVPALVPQTASYLVMPNALFTTGLTDMAKQNALLANIRTSVLGGEEKKQTGFFLYTYGSTGTLSSERGPLKYGYGADIRYAALQAGVTLAAIEQQNVTTRFGLVGTYGQMSFTPKDMQDAGKSTLDKWSLTAYSSIQHDNGFYIDTLLSYGIIKGDIGNAIIGKTAKLKNANILSISTTVGRQFATGMEGLTFEPQAQLAYQHLTFNAIEDTDNLTIDMHNPSQWLIRVGGRLTKTLSTENNRPMSFYGKANLIKTFGDDGTIHIGRDFDLDPMGPAIEGGVGINAQLSRNLSLHGDVSYQQKLQKTGISGASFSGGIRYQF